MSNNSNNTVATEQKDNTTIVETYEESSTNSNNALDLDKVVEKLSRQLKKELDSRSKLKTKNRRIGLCLGVGAIVFSSLATIFGIFITIDEEDNLWKILTPVSATIAATLQAALLGYPVDKRAVFHRLLAAQTESLQDSLEVRQHLKTITPASLEEISKELQQIKLKGAAEEPDTGNQASSATLKNIEDTLAQIKQIKLELEKLKTKPAS